VLAAGIVYGACLLWAYLSGKALHVGDLMPLSEEQEQQAEMIAAIETLPEDV